MKSFIPAILLLAFACLPVEAQTLPFRSYSIANGLSESVAHDMMQDSDGYIWIATGYGLNRFDGIRFQNYYEEDGLSDNQTHAVYQDRSGRIWVGTASGVNVIADDTIRTVAPLDTLSTSTILAIFEDSNGNMWFATDGEGVWVLDLAGNLNRFGTDYGLAGTRVRDIVEDRAGTLWFGTNEGLTNLSRGVFVSYTVDDGLPGNNIYDLESDPMGGFWMATRSGISHYFGGTIRNFGESEGLPDNGIYSISSTPDGDLWIGTEEGGSYYSNGEFSNYTTSDGLSHNVVYSTLFDREQNIWFGTFGGGVNLFLGDHFRNFTVEEGLPNNVITSVTGDRSGNYWIASFGGGITRYDGSELQVFDEEEGLIDNKVNSVMVDSRGRLFIGTRLGLSIYENGEFVNHTDSVLTRSGIRSVIETSLGETYWMGTEGAGALRFRNGTFEQYSEEDGLANNTVMAVEEDRRGNIWFATYGGVSRYSDGTFTSYTVRDGLPNNGVLDILEDREGNLWFSTFGGIARYDGNSFEAITPAEGLPDNVCNFMIQDAAGIFWIGTSRGVVRFDYDQYPGRGSAGSSPFRLLSRNQGVVANEMNTGAAFVGDDGDLWFGTVGGLTRFTPYESTIPQYSIPPKIHIDHIRVSGVTVPGDTPLEIGGDSRNISFEFTGISFFAPEQVTYEYRLQGSGDEWQQTAQRTVQYSALWPGEYEFQIRAKNGEGIRSVEIASVMFTVLAPFWMRWWFILLVLGAIGTIIYFIYHYYRFRKMFEIERMRVRIASDLHDDVGSSLTEIALQTDFLKTADLNSDMRKSLTQIGEQSRRIVTSLDDIVWSIDARNDTLGDLTDRMQDYVNNMLPGKEVFYRFDDLNMGEKLSVSVKENIYLIFKEAINNIAKHSSANRLEVELKNKNGSFDLYIRDNGTGPDPGKRKTGQGLRNMKMRAERIGAELDFENGTGFTVHLSGRQER